MPVGEQRVGDRVDPLRVGRVADVDQQAVALAGAGGEVELRVDRDVVAGVGDRRRRPGDARRVQSASGRRVLQAVDRAGRPRRVNSRGSLTTAAFCGAASGTLMTSIRHCDGFVAGRRAAAGAVAAGQLGRRADAAGALRRRCRRCSVVVRRSTSVCVCEPRQVWTPPTCTGAVEVARCRRCGRRGSASSRRPPGSAVQSILRAWSPRPT